MKKTVWSLILHCHLPFIRHPRYEDFIEENWLFEAVTETYIPLLEAFQKLRREGLNYRITVSFSPSLCEMLADKILQEKCLLYIAKRVDLCKRELKQPRNKAFRPAINFYFDRFTHQLERYNHGPGEAILEGFKDLHTTGHIDLITCPATHALLPLCSRSTAAKAQIEHGCRCFKKHFGYRPTGMWLPECAYSPEIEPLLLNSGIQYSFLESHGLLLAEPTPRCGVFAPIGTPGGTVLFARDPQSSKQVWSADEGYPGNPHYREFHVDLGFEAPYDYIKPYLSPSGERHQLGLKYHRITGDGSRKLPYDPEAAKQKAILHARHFVRQRISQSRKIKRYLKGTTPIIISPYDGELFGHWWLEGPIFLENVIRNMCSSPSIISTATPQDFLVSCSKIDTVEPSSSTWGYQGYYDVWVNGDNDWIYRHLSLAEKQMESLAHGYGASSNKLVQRAVKQCARELMLAQSSDWPFLIGTDSATEYASERLTSHFNNFWTLSTEIREDILNEESLTELENTHNIFKQINTAIFCRESD